jgi:guanylate kinase
LFKLAEYKYSISATTRTPRSGEAHGVDYYFFSKDEFFKKADDGDFLEYAEYSGNYYGTLRKPVTEMLEAGKNVILEIEVQGAVNIKKDFPDALMIFITPPNFGELEKRLRSRGTESEEVIRRRLEIAKEEINNIDRYDYFIINEDNKQKEVAFVMNNIINHCENRDIDRYRAGKERSEKFIDAFFAGYAVTGKL